MYFFYVKRKRGNGEKQKVYKCNDVSVMYRINTNSVR